MIEIKRYIFVDKFNNPIIKITEDTDLESIGVSNEELINIEINKFITIKDKKYQVQILEGKEFKEKIENKTKLIVSELLITLV